MAYIRFEHLDKSYGEQNLFQDFSLTVEQGGFVTLLGPSGCGKSTLLRCLAGLETIARGKIYLDGKDITHLAPRKRNVGMIFQQYSLFPTMTVYRNIAFGLKMAGQDKKLIQEKIGQALEIVELSGFEKKYPSQLSGGEQQRVALARCLVVEPKVLLLDEPFSAIDAKLRKSLQKKICEIHRDLQMTTIFVTHDQDEAMTMSDTIHLMQGGKIIQSGTPLDLYAQPQSYFAASFMGNYNLLTKDQFMKLTGKHFGYELAMIRPELIRLSAKPFAYNQSAYYFPATVENIIPQGNIIRYQLSAQDVSLTVDTLFNQTTFFEKQQSLYLCIQEEDILHTELNHKISQAI